ncbi:Uncharacterized protein dnm_003410 [Desulfonema magnum]|uniref:Uncharacterized protein n=1 Tax=Desulfonema magnum TaxID=45655 RepID=A0A975BF99_9BACT|nr:Uncharacterized protein dnm_003410 [Desulfonema magnum]
MVTDTSVSDEFKCPDRNTGKNNYQLSIINHQLSIINYQLSIINYQLSIINYQLSIINYQFMLFYLSELSVY